MQDPEELGRIAVALAIAFGDATNWDELSNKTAKALRGVLSEGISGADLVIREADIGDYVVVAATYTDEESDFSAEYLLVQDEVVYSYEN